jgi:hypothetical protein
MRHDRATLIQAIMDAGCDREVAEAAADMLWRRRTPVKRRPGRPAWIPTDADRDRVMRLRGSAVPAKIIASIMGVDETTLRQKCRHELDNGSEMLKAALAGVVVRQGLRGDWRAAIGWLARFGGDEWKRPQVHLIGGTGTPITVAQQVQVYLPENHRPTIGGEPAAIADRETDLDPVPPC